ncbi:MAG: hypothetical protein FP824_07175 [Euryarchaeota archaeon]|nr:hypothetical protein [Euryarchaeota archaeon]
MCDDGYFTITKLHRDDLKALYPEKKEYVENLSDGEMKYLARRMNDDYLEQLYWDSLKILSKELVGR